MFGPFTFKQFIYIAGGGGACLMLFLKLPLLLAIPLCIPIAALAGALAFYKINNKSFLEILEAGMKHYFSSHLYLWRHEDKKETPAEAKKTAEVTIEPVTRAPFRGMTSGRLRELAQQLDTEPAQEES